MKQIIALLALMMLAIVPPAIADHDEGATTHTDATLTADTTAVDAKLTTTEDANATLTPRDRMKERMRNGGPVVKETRAVVKDIRAMKVETRAAVKAERAEIKALAENLKSCRGRKNDDCDKKRVDAKLEVKDSLLKAADEVILLLEKSKARVSESDLAAKAEITAELEVQIKAVTDAKAKAEALGENSTREEIKDASTALRTAVAEARRALQIGAHSLVAARFGGVLKIMEQLETRLTNALADLKSKGVDVSSVDTTAFSASLDLAQSSHQEATDLYVQAKTDKNRELMQKATQKMREAHAALKDAQQELRAILKELKDLKGGSESLATERTETTATTDGASMTASADATASAEAQ